MEDTTGYLMKQKHRQLELIPLITTTYKNNSGYSNLDPTPVKIILTNVVPLSLILVIPMFSIDPPKILNVKNVTENWNTTLKN